MSLKSTKETFFFSLTKEKIKSNSLASNKQTILFWLQITNEKLKSKNYFDVVKWKRMSKEATFTLKMAPLEFCLMGRQKKVVRLKILKGNIDGSFSLYISNIFNEVFIYQKKNEVFYWIIVFVRHLGAMPLLYFYKFYTKNIIYLLIFCSFW